uniref:Uncharacterized protein n=1 Tax=Glossina brevipalpis TaxID=37001 RepID=A0A1A9X3D5_9MUSC
MKIILIGSVIPLIVLLQSHAILHLLEKYSRKRLIFSGTDRLVVGFSYHNEEIILDEEIKKSTDEALVILFAEVLLSGAGTSRSIACKLMLRVLRTHSRTGTNAYGSGAIRQRR